MTVRGAYALLAAGVAAFVVYGSLVPFHFERRPHGDALPAFRWCLEHRLWPQSRSDGLANFALGVPLGFAVLGACPAGWRRLAALPLLGACVGLAAAVEFAQLYIPSRTCAGSDVLAQGLGAAAGMAAWFAVGEWVTRFAVLAANHPRAGGRAGRLLAAYLIAVAGVQLLPLDLDPSPADLYRRLRDGHAVTLRPFAEPLTWDAAAKWLTLAGLFVPVGVFAARVPTLSAGWAVAGGFAAAALTEAGQLLVSRHASTSDALVGGLGAAVGWVVGRGKYPAVVLMAAWLTGLAVIWWQPFDFHPSAQTVNLLPLADLLQADYLHDADIMVTRVLLFAPLGALVGRRGWLVCGLAAVALEAGQVFLPGRFPSSTDVVLAVAGGALGSLGRRWATGGRA